MDEIRNDSQQKKAWQILLTEKGLTAYRAAKLADVPYTTLLNGMKRDIGRMEIATALALSQALGMTIDELVHVIRYK
ncbi:MAG: hypothetical protein IKG46_02170 [Solobacterium sp.]|nr:hypothetical protein [Solobacterium sp.]